MTDKKEMEQYLLTLNANIDIEDYGKKYTRYHLKFENLKNLEIYLYLFYKSFNIFIWKNGEKIGDIPDISNLNYNYWKKILNSANELCDDKATTLEKQLILNRINVMYVHKKKSS